MPADTPTSASAVPGIVPSIVTISYSVVPDDLIPGTRDGGDPLGFRAVANLIARDLVPGLTQSTDVARALSLLCVGLHYGHAGPAGTSVDETYKRFERLWVLSTQCRTPRGADFSGVRAARRLLTHHDTDLPLTTPLLQNELGAGMWGAYRRLALSLNLIEQTRSGTRPAQHRLTESGRQLAAAARKKINNGRHIGPRLTGGSAPLDLLRGLRATTKCSPAETQIISRQLGQYDRRVDGAHSRLHAAYVAAGVLSLDTMHTAPWPPGHRAAAVAARAITTLIDNYERSFRIAAVEGAAQDPAPLSDATWAAIGHWDAVGIGRLRPALATSKDPIAQLFSHHEDLSRLRHSIAWERGQTAEDRLHFRPPDFALSSAASLYAQKVRPRG